MRGRAWALAALLLCGCAPALNWRDVRPGGSHVAMQFPCRPALQERRVALAGVPSTLSLLACEAAGQTWALAWADVGDPARLPPALAQLRLAAAANIDARQGRALPFKPAGAEPDVGAQRQLLTGRLPDAAAVQMQIAVFAVGTQAYQATALGARLDGEGADNFFASIRLRP